MSSKCQEFQDTAEEFEGIKTPSFPKTTVPYGTDGNGNIICAVYGYNQEKSQFFIEIPVICTDLIKTYLPPTFKQVISALSLQEAKRREKIMQGVTKEILELIAIGHIDRAIELIQFHKIKF